MCVCIKGGGRKEDCASWYFAYNMQNCHASLPSVLPISSGVACVVLKFLALSI